MPDSEFSSSRTACRTCIPVCWIVLILLDFFLVAFTLAQDVSSTAANSPRHKTETRIPGPGDLNSNETRFEAIDVFLDSGTDPLAAWQLELNCVRSDVQIVGIEGGDHPAFREPPYYDPRAMNNNRVILGGFNTASTGDLPTGRSRIARVHVQVKGGGEQTWNSELTAAATSDGRRIPAEISVEQARG